MVRSAILSRFATEDPLPHVTTMGIVMMAKPARQTAVMPEDVRMMMPRVASRIVIVKSRPSIRLPPAQIPVSTEHVMWQVAIVLRSIPEEAIARAHRMIRGEAPVRWIGAWITAIAAIPAASIASAIWDSVPMLPTGIAVPPVVRRAAPLEEPQGEQVEQRGARPVAQPVVGDRALGADRALEVDPAVPIPVVVLPEVLAFGALRNVAMAYTHARAVPGKTPAIPFITVSA